MTNNDPQKTRHWATRTTLKSGDELMCPRTIRYFCSTIDTSRITLVKNLSERHE